MMYILLEFWKTDNNFGRSVEVIGIDYLNKTDQRADPKTLEGERRPRVPNH